MHWWEDESGRNAMLRQRDSFEINLTPTAEGVAWAREQWESMNGPDDVLSIRMVMLEASRQINASLHYSIDNQTFYVDYRDGRGWRNPITMDWLRRIGGPMVAAPRGIAPNCVKAIADAICLKAETARPSCRPAADSSAE